MKGLGMKQGNRPNSRPTCRHTWRYVVRRSAVSSARPKVKFSSSCPGASSWSPWIMSRPMAVEYSITLWITGWSSENWSMW